jgi:hypothetical protein
MSKTTVLIPALLAPTSGVLADGQQTLASAMHVVRYRSSARIARPRGARGPSGIRA